jgi:hypothetical protein
MPAKKRSAATKPEPEAEEQFSTASLSIFEFTPDDLRSNQRGYLTDRQRGWLRSTGQGIQSCSISSAVVALGFVLLGLTITLGLYLSNEDSRRAVFSNPMSLLGLAAAGAIGVGAIGLSILLARRQAANVTRADLRRVQGTVRLDQDYSPRSSLTSYHVFVGDQKFTFGDDVSSIFREGQRYTIYYCKSGAYQLIMSFEGHGA